MKIMYSTGLLILIVCLFQNTSAIAAEDKKAVKNAEETIQRFKASSKNLTPFFKNSAGYAVFPSVGKGAVGVGGAYGRGVVYRKGKVIGEAKLTQISIGFQLGGQAYSEIIFLKKQRDIDAFTKNDFAFSAQVSAVAADKGVSANMDYDNGVAVFTLAKAGLMYEASVAGQKFHFTPNAK